MPNWCQNKVVIRSDDQSIIDKITSIAPSENEAFSMENFMPIPPELLDNGGWYDWSVANWGTKWDMDNVYVDNAPKSFTIEYSTAWSPNLMFWETFSTLYPVTISHQYYEEGMCFIGEAIIKNGITSDHSTEITPELYQRVGAVLDEEGNIDWDQDQDFNLFEAFPIGAK